MCWHLIDTVFYLDFCIYMKLTITVFLPPDKPGCPVNFHATDMTEDTVSLAWAVPEDDGGCEIKYYIVEKRESSKRSWQSVARTTELLMSVASLQEGTTYMFRVAATNDVGNSEWVELDKPITPKSQYSECSIVVEDLRCIVEKRFSVAAAFSWKCSPRLGCPLFETR